MKFELKKIMIIAGICVIIGIVLASVGLFFGASTQIYIDSTGVHTSDTKTKKIEYQKIPGTVENLDIDLSASDLEIILADENAIEAVYKGDKMKPSIKQDDKSVSIISPPWERHFSIFNFDELATIGESKVKLYLDKKTMFQSLNIKLNTGTIVVGEGLKTQRINIENNLGDLTLLGAQADDVAVKLDCGTSVLNNLTSKTFKAVHHLGDLKASNMKIQTGDFESNSGNTILEKSSIDQINLKSSLGTIEGKSLALKGGKIVNKSGDIVLEGNLTGKLEIESKLGEVQVKTDEPQEAYAYALETKVGDIYLNGQKTQGTLGDSNNIAANQIIVNNAAGNIRVDFK